MFNSVRPAAKYEPALRRTGSVFVSVKIFFIARALGLDRLYPFRILGHQPPMWILYKYDL